MDTLTSPMLLVLREALVMGWMHARDVVAGCVVLDVVVDRADQRRRRMHVVCFGCFRPFLEVICDFDACCGGGGGGQQRME